MLEEEAKLVKHLVLMLLVEVKLEKGLVGEHRAIEKPALATNCWDCRRERQATMQVGRRALEDLVVLVMLLEGSERVEWGSE